jgi:hypothetical protein
MKYRTTCYNRLASHISHFMPQAHIPPAALRLARPETFTRSREEVAMTTAISISDLLV